MDIMYTGIALKLAGIVLLCIVVVGWFVAKELWK